MHNPQYPPSTHLSISHAPTCIMHISMHNIMICTQRIAFSVFTRCFGSLLLVWTLRNIALATCCLLIFALGSSLFIGHNCKLFGSFGPLANDDYLFSALYCLHVCALACQRHSMALEQCSECNWHADSSCTPKTSYEVTLQSLVALITQMNRIDSHYCIAPL